MKNKKIEISMFIIGAALCLSSSCFSAELMEVGTPQEIADKYILEDACEKINSVLTDSEYQELIHDYDNLDLAVNCDDPNASENFKAEQRINNL